MHYTVGQKWIQLDGAYTSDELRSIAKEIDRHYEMALKKPSNKIENNGDKK